MKFKMGKEPELNHFYIPPQAVCTLLSSQVDHGATGLAEDWRLATDDC